MATDRNNDTVSTNYTPSGKVNAISFPRRHERAIRLRCVSAGNDTFAHDAEGRQIDKSGTVYDFDYAHRLIQIGAGTTFQYDGAGNRLRATRNGSMTKYIYDAAGNLIAEADNANTITRYYIHGAGLLGLIEGNATWQRQNG